MSELMIYTGLAGEKAVQPRNLEAEYRKARVSFHRLAELQRKFDPTKAPVAVEVLLAPVMVSVQEIVDWRMDGLRTKIRDLRHQKRDAATPV